MTPFWRRRSADDFSAEIEAHLRIETDRLMRERGLAEPEARAAARRAFGNVGSVVERFYDARAGIWAEHGRRDVVRAIRSLMRSPGFTLVVLATLGLGIGAVTSVFSLFDIAALRAPRYGGGRVFALTESSKGVRPPFSAVSATAIAELRRVSTSFNEVAVSADSNKVLASGGDPIRIIGQAIDTTFLGMLRVGVERGRLFASDDVDPGAAGVIISDSLWRGRFNGDETLVGRAIRLDGRERTVIGILRPGFRFPYETDIWYPLPVALAPDTARYAVLAKLRDGVSLHDARAELSAIGAGLTRTDSARFPHGTELVVQDGMVQGQGSAFEDALETSPFMIAAICVFLVVCANIAGLSHLRAAGRKREMAIRASLGGSAARLLSQNLTESLVLGLCGGAIGAVLSVWGLHGLLRLLGPGLPDWVTVGLDWRVLAFTFAVSLVATVAFGLGPARQAIRIDLVKSLKVGGVATTAGGHERGAHRQLVVELALVLVLVLSTSVFVATARKAATIDLGYPRNRIITAGFRLDTNRYRDARESMGFGRAVTGLLERNPAFVAAAYDAGFDRLVSDDTAAARRGASTSPGSADQPLIVPGAPGRHFEYVGKSVVSQGFQRASGLTLRRGRWFDVSDDAGSAPVAVVTGGLARRLWPRDEAVGKTVQFGVHSTPITVVGVVNDVRGGSLFVEYVDDVLYLSDRQALGRATSVVVRARADARGLSSVVASTIRTVDPDLLVDGPQLAEHYHNDNDEVLRPAIALSGLFSTTALVLALMGIYGSVAYAVTRRTREIGIRIALGAERTDVIADMMRGGARFIGVGLAVGMLLWFGAWRLIQALLSGAAPFDPLMEVLVVAGFGAVALLACYIPSRRATRVDPMIALRAE